MDQGLRIPGLWKCEAVRDLYGRWVRSGLAEDRLDYLEHRRNCPECRRWLAAATAFAAMAEHPKLTEEEIENG